jgi:hypothetical protein
MEDPNDWSMIESGYVEIKNSDGKGIKTVELDPNGKIITETDNSIKLDTHFN